MKEFISIGEVTDKQSARLLLKLKKLTHNNSEEEIVCHAFGRQFLYLAVIDRFNCASYLKKEGRQFSVCTFDYPQFTDTLNQF